MRLTGLLSAAFGVASLAWAVAAAAQTPGSQGPLVLEPLSHGFVIAPDVKITKINGNVETLAGGYAGRVQDRHLLIAGAGYWLANAKDDRQLGYGGVVGGWIFSPDSTVSFTAKGLAGVGWMSERGTITFDDRDRRHADMTIPDSRRYRFDRQFFVAEPELDVQLKISAHLRVTAGGSYRVVDLPRGLDDLVKGPSGSISAQIRFGQ